MRSNLLELISTTEVLRRNLDLAYEVDLLRAWRSHTRRVHRGDRAIVRFQGAVPSTAEVRGFVNAGIVVGLYGALEQFVERLVADAVETYIACCSSYDELPTSVLRNYSMLSAEVLTAMTGDRYFGGLTQLELAAGLHGTLSRNVPIPFETNIFSRHTANFRWGLIKTTFHRAGLDVSPAEGSSHLLDAMKVHFSDEAQSTYVIDDLAERRNALAHGSGGDLLSLDLLGSYIAVVQGFANALYDAVATGVLNMIMSGAAATTTSLGRPDKVFRKHIAGYNNLALNVQEGHVIAVVTKKSVKAMILEEIQVDGTTVPVATAGTAAGLRLSDEFSSRSRLVLLPDAARRVAR